MPQRRAYLAQCEWPVGDLSAAGQLSWLFTGGGDGHLGIYIPYCNAAEVAAHTGNPLVSRFDAYGATHVNFDHGYDKYARFQTLSHTEYWGEPGRGFFALFPIECADAAAVHAACVEVAERRSYNALSYRFHTMVGGLVPRRPVVVGNDRVGPCNCGGLAVRIIAAAASGDDRALSDDAFAAATLGVPLWSLASPFAPSTLMGFGPRSALEALQGGSFGGAPVLGDAVGDFSGARRAERYRTFAGLSQV